MTGVGVGAVVGVVGLCLCVSGVGIAAVVGVVEVCFCVTLEDVTAVVGDIKPCTARLDVAAVVDVNLCLCDRSGCCCCG